MSRITEASTEDISTADCVVSFCLPAYALVSDDNADPAAVNASIVAHRRADVANDRAWAKAASVTAVVGSSPSTDGRSRRAPAPAPASPWERDGPIPAPRSQR